MKLTNLQAIPCAFLDIFFPKRCVGCGQYGRFVCLECAKKIKLFQTFTCPECGKIMELGRFCPACKSRTETKLSGIIIAAKYDEGPTKEMIYGLKYLGLTALAGELASIVAGRIRSLPIISDCLVVPVPLHIRKFHRRGFNQSELIARSLSEILDLPGGDALVRTKDTASQVGLSRSKRLKNVVGAFRCEDTELVSGKNILLVDDVMTTGATLSECAKALKDAGAKKIWGVVVARNVK